MPAEVTAALAGLGVDAATVKPRYAVDAYRIEYTTTDGSGREVVASGLVAVPIKAAGLPSPVVSYQHATIFENAAAPSQALGAGEPTLLLASLGYLVVAPDYVGYGSTRGTPHPYLLAAPSAAAVLDLLRAARTWRRTQGITDNGQLFLVGYSEGGYVTLAAQRALQALHGPGAVTLSVPGAGPYDVGLTLALLLNRVRAESPLLASLIGTGSLQALSTTVRNELRRLLLRLLVPADSDVMFQGMVLDLFLSDDTTGIVTSSNVDDWRPDAPVHLFHGRDDTTVPYAVSVRTEQLMQERGATNVTLTDCAAVPASHIGCVPDYVNFMLSQLGLLARDL